MSVDEVSDLLLPGIIKCLLGSIANCLILFDVKEFCEGESPPLNHLAMCGH